MMILGGGSQRGSANCSKMGKYAVGRPVIVESSNRILSEALTESEGFFVGDVNNRTDDDTGRGQPTWLGQLLEDGKVDNPRIVEPHNIVKSPHPK